MEEPLVRAAFLFLPRRGMIIKIIFFYRMVQTLPGFIDAHVHLREPGATHKEDFLSGSRAAVRGGFTFLIDMPNNVLPTVSVDRLNEKITIAQEKSICDIGFYFGTNGKNTDQFVEAWQSPYVFGLKVYCNHTTGEMIIEDTQVLEEIFSSWKSEKPILVHAEGAQLRTVLTLARAYHRHLHVCHISRAEEVDFVRSAKQNGQMVTAGVCPHHLFMTCEVQTAMRGFAMMKPPLGSSADQKALWGGLKDGTIDIIETDHAPHTRAEKESENPAFGVPGLETAVGLMYTAVKGGRVAAKDVVRWLYTNPKLIFCIPDQLDTYIEFDAERKWIVGADGYESKSNWSPFEGWTLFGKVETVVVHGEKVLERGKIIE